MEEVNTSSQFSLLYGVVQDRLPQHNVAPLWVLHKCPQVSSRKLIPDVGLWEVLSK